jgi:hypothetical protein
MSVQTINAEILQGTFTNEQLSSIVDAVKFARARLADKTRNSLRIGSKVTFAGRQGMQLVGTVEKIAIKNVVVNTPQGRWRVAASLLQAV